MDAHSALSELEARASRSDETVCRPFAPDTAEVLEALARNLPDPVPPKDLVARPCPTSAATYHWEALQRLLSSDGREVSWRAARAVFHARWLLSIAAPEDRDQRPLVSFVVPVFNRAHMVGEAIGSALAQSYPKVEVLVVDDGSTDDLESALTPYRERISVIRQTNRGVSAARNRAVARAKGEYVHFLDSDNVVDPEAVERWIDACRCVGDADLCYSPVRFGLTYLRTPGFLKPPNGGRDCPTRDLTDVIARRHPFTMTGVLVPRWLVLANGGFDERLRRGEDTRFWFEIGLRGAKVIGLESRMNEARPQSTGLSALRVSGEQARVLAMNFLDLQKRPDLWQHLPGSFRPLSARDAWQWLGSCQEPLVEETRSAILEQFELMHRHARSEGLRLAPTLRALLRAARRAGRQLTGDSGAQGFHQQFVTTLERILASDKTTI